MPFKSKQQMKACFATNGFHGKIDCDEWAKDTNYKSLPRKKEKGGTNMYRPRNCKRCGGKMQSGGTFEEQLKKMLAESTKQSDIDATPYIDYTPSIEKDPIQDAINKGILEPPKGYDSAQQWYNFMNGKQEEDVYPLPSNWMQNLGIGMMRGTNLLSEISGRVERGRQNRYDYTQQTALGQMNPQPLSDYQPSPYNLYAKYGGKLSKYRSMRHGGNPILAPYHNLPKEEYDSIVAQLKGVVPSGYHIMPDGTLMRDSEMRGYMAGGGLSRDEDYGSKKRPYPSVSSSDFAGGHRSYPIPTKADAIDALRLAHLHGRQDVIAKVYTKYPELRKHQMGGQINTLTDANKFAKDFAVRHGSWQGEDTYVDKIPQFLGPDGKPYIPPTRTFQPVPSGIKDLQWDAQKNVAYYEDPKTGYLVEADPLLLNSPRFKKPSTNIGMASLRKGGNWIQKAVNPAHKGYCTPMTKSTCTPRRKALAMTFKKHHGFHKKNEGGII